MLNLITRAFSRHLVQHPWQLALAILGITVGVAVIVAIRLTQYSAIDAFEAATRTTSGAASHRITGVDGTLAHTAVEEIYARFPSLKATPVLRTATKVVLLEHSPLIVLGVDPVSRADLADSRHREPVLFDPQILMSQPGAAVINDSTARALNLQPGSSLEISSGGNRTILTIIAVVPGPQAAGGLINDVAVVDIATAQEMLGIHDRVGHLDVSFDDSVTARMLRDALGPQFEILDLAEESRSVKQMTQAFYSNLTALSLMALLVGMFLIYNTETFLVLQRRRIFGRLRALGVSAPQLLGAIVFEAALIGVVGSLSGIAVGVLLADGLLAIVSTTINDLYFEASIDTLALAPATLIGCFVIGVGATVVAAAVPAVYATRIEPNLAIVRTTLKRHNIARVCAATFALFVACNATAWAVLAATHSTNAGFAAICLVVVGFAALCPVTIIALGALAGRMFGRHMVPEQLGLRTVSTSLNRTGTATAALMIATAASIGIGVMVTSFRASVSDWLDGALRADLYIADSNFDNIARARKIPDAIGRRIAALPTVDAVSSVLRREVTGPSGRLRLSAFELTAAARAGFRFKHGDPAGIWHVWRDNDVVIVTEPYAYHNGIAVGDSIVLRTDAGSSAFRVAGIYLDYASERGSVSLSRATYDRHWQTSGVDGFGVYANARANREELRDAVTAIFGPESNLIANSPAELKRVSLTVFDRTFLITELLRAIAVAVSFIGVLGALLAQQLERTREYGVLRAVGFNAVEMSRNVQTQTLLLGASAALIAIPVGLLIGIILIDVINPRSFGWTMTRTIEPALIVKSCAIAVAAAFAAGLYPSWHAARIEPADAMRYE